MHLNIIILLRKEDRDVFEKIMKNHKNGSNPDKNDILPKIDDFKVYWIHYGSMHRYTENWIQT